MPGLRLEGGPILRAAFLHPLSDGGLARTSCPRVVKVLSERKHSVPGRSEWRGHFCFTRSYRISATPVIAGLRAPFPLIWLEGSVSSP